jgi:hypothetical protein
MLALEDELPRSAARRQNIRGIEDAQPRFRKHRGA